MDKRDKCIGNSEISRGKLKPEGGGSIGRRGKEL